jgi:hypothetical protein
MQQEDIVPLEKPAPADWRASVYAKAAADEQWRAEQRNKRTPQRPYALILGLGVVALVILGVIGKFCLDFLMMPKAPPVLAETKWQTFEEGRIKVQLPGPPVFLNFEVAGQALRTVRVEPTPQSCFMVSYMPSALPVQGKSFSVDGLLNAGLDGSRDHVAKYGCHELYRKDVKLNSIRGKELVMTLPKTKGTFIVRGYFHEGRLFIVVVGGVGMLPDHPDIVKFLDSLQIEEG